MPEWIRSDPRKRCLQTSDLNAFFGEVTKVVSQCKADQVFVSLSDNGLTLASVEELIEVL